MTTSTPAQHRFIVPPELHGQRLDRALVALLPDFSRSRLQHWIEQGQVTVAGTPRRPREAVATGQEICVTVVPEPAVEDAPEERLLDVVHEDAALIVVNKPAGLVVHPGAGNRTGTLLNALLHHAPELVQVPRAGIVHRIDKDTSGLLVVARTLEAHAALVADLAHRRIRREYEAVVRGVLTAGGTVDAPIGRDDRDRTRMRVRAGAREAVTHYRVLERFRAHTHLSLRLETGRTHQIRVHMQHLRYPLVGDPVYGRLALPAGATPALREALNEFRRQALHARRLALVHPVSGEEMQWEAALPADLQDLLDVLRADTKQAQR